MKTSRPLLVCVLLGSLFLSGCLPSEWKVRPVSYDVDLALEPPSHSLTADVTVRLEDLEDDPERDPERKRRVDLLLHPDLELRSVSVDGATLLAHKERRGRTTEGSISRPTKHRLILEGSGEPLSVRLQYAGALFQDVESGEEEGQVHNFLVSAHVADEGLYLEPGGYWYPRVELGEEVDPEQTLADYSLSVRPIESFELVAGLERAEDEEQAGELRYRSPFPLQGLVLLGGPLERASRTHGDVRLHAVLAPGKEEVARDILAASAEYLNRYEKLIGPYPFREFTVLEAFFSSGFAFPTCTQIAGSQLSEYQQYRRHGYLDHELLHNWYGNGIFVDPRDGNWCEGLASYLGNYYGHVLDGNEKQARKERRNHSNFLSSIRPENDRPLGTFGLEGGAGRGIGYQKGAAIFHMLERRIGTEPFFAGLRRLASERMGEFASWEQLQRAFEEASNTELDDFFEQWVEDEGAPLLELTDAVYREEADVVTVTISQSNTEFELDVPLRLYFGEVTEDVTVRVDEAADTVDVPCGREGLTAVELDPDYHLFRRLKPDEVMPTYGITRRADPLRIVAREGALAEGYRVLVDANERGVRTEPRSLTARELAESSLLVLGEAVRDPLVVDLLARTRSPVEFVDGGFRIGDEEYFGPRQAVFLTVHHPDVPRGGVTVYYGNSPAALSNARVLGYYPNSLLVFDTPPGDDGVGSGATMPRAEVIRRIDFEFHERIDF